MIQYIAEDITIPFLKKSNVTSWIKSTAAVYGMKTGAISFIFCSDERIFEINNKYLNHNYFTDIITFDYTENSIISGDIFISVETVKSNSEEYNVNFDLELKRIIIHGILHLCGQDDKTPEAKSEMTLKENLALDNYKEK